MCSLPAVLSYMRSLSTFCLVRPAVAIHRLRRTCQSASQWSCGASGHPVSCDGGRRRPIFEGRAPVCEGGQLRACTVAVRPVSAATGRATLPAATPRGVACLYAADGNDRRRARWRWHGGALRPRDEREAALLVLGDDRELVEIVPREGDFVGGCGVRTEGGWAIKQLRRMSDWAGWVAAVAAAIKIKS